MGISSMGAVFLRVMQKVCDAGLPESKFLGGDTDLCINIYRNGSETVFDDGIVTGLRRDCDAIRILMTLLQRKTQHLKDFRN